MPGGDGDGDRSRERLGYQYTLLGQRFAGRFHVLIERQLRAVANDGRGDVFVQCVKERREQLAGAVQSWQQDEMRCGAQTGWLLLRPTQGRCYSEPDEQHSAAVALELHVAAAALQPLAD